MYTQVDENLMMKFFLSLFFLALVPRVKYDHVKFTI